MFACDKEAGRQRSTCCFSCDASPLVGGWMLNVEGKKKMQKRGRNERRIDEREGRKAKGDEDVGLMGSSSSSSSSRLIEVGQSLLFVGRPDPPGRTTSWSDPNKGERRRDRSRIDQQVKRVSRTNRVAV